MFFVHKSRCSSLETSRLYDLLNYIQNALVPTKKKNTWQCLESCKLAGSEYDASSGLVYQTQLPVGLFLQPLHDSTGSRGSTAPRTLVCSSQHVIIFCCVHVCFFPMWKDEHLNLYSGAPRHPMMRSTFNVFRNIFIYFSYKKTFRNNFSQHLRPFSITMARGIHLPPAAAAAAMACSSIMVVSSSLLLRRFQPRAHGRHGATSRDDLAPMHGRKHARKKQIEMRPLTACTLA